MNREREEERVLALTFLRRGVGGGGMMHKKKKKKRSNALSCIIRK